MEVVEVILKDNMYVRHDNDVAFSRIKVSRLTAVPLDSLELHLERPLVHVSGKDTKKNAAFLDVRCFVQLCEDFPTELCGLFDLIHRYVLRYRGQTVVYRSPANPGSELSAVGQRVFPDAS